MATTIRRTVKMDELTALMKRVNQESIPPEIIAQRRKVSAEANKVVDEMEPLEEDIKDMVRRERGEKLIG